jgi:hypothetical protein
MLDQTLSALTKHERRQIWAALLAASVPHWLPPGLLGTLCDTTIDAAERLAENLRRLPCITPCREHEEGAFEVHKEVRLPLREHLRIWHPDRWERHSRMAREYFKKRKDSASRIEALYHLFAINKTSAAGACQQLSGYFRDYRLKDDQVVLSEVLTELSDAGWLSGPALVEATLSTLWIRAGRGGTGPLKREAAKVLALAMEAAPDRLADAWILMGDVRMARARPGLALEAYQHASTILTNQIAQDPRHPAMQRDLAIAHVRIGLAHQRLDRPLASLISLEKSRLLMENLCDQNPSHPARQWELEGILTLLEDVRRWFLPVPDHLHCRG